MANTNAHVADISVDDQGTIVRLVPQTEAGEEWLLQNCQAEPWQWFAGGLCVEHRYADDILFGIHNDGLVIEGR